MPAKIMKDRQKKREKVTEGTCAVLLLPLGLPAEAKAQIEQTKRATGENNTVVQTVT